jgi:hypothetical protein
MTKAVATLAIAAALVGSGAGAATSGVAGFTPRVTNPWFPLVPGSTYIYRGVKDGRSAVDVVTVAKATKTIDRVRCAVVHDRLYLSGRLHERTTDWYTQDERGNVWYYGESTAELDAKGRVTSTEGTWQAGRDGARPGIYMPARPRVGRSGRQEFYKGHAEDHFRVLSLRARVRVPYVSTARALLTKEWTPLEPGKLDHKFYVRGIGIVLERTVKGGDERLALVAFQRGA